MEHPCDGCLWRSTLPPAAAVYEDEKSRDDAAHWCAHHEFYGWVGERMRCEGFGKRLRGEAERA